MAGIIEKVGSRSGTIGIENPYRELLYHVHDELDDEAVEVLVEQTAPPTYRGLFFQYYEIDHLGRDQWDVTVHYGKVEPRAAETGSGGGEGGGEGGEEVPPVFSFDTGGGTAHITQSLETIGQYMAVGVTAIPDFQGAIGVNNDQVEGVDITIPGYAFQETRRLRNSLLTPEYLNRLFELTGRTNNATWRNSKGQEFEEGEVLVIGVSGTERSGGPDGDSELTFKYAASKNMQDIAIGAAITVETKKGFEYLWIRYKDATSANTHVKQPHAAYVERVYESGDFAGLRPTA